MTDIMLDLMTDQQELFQSVEKVCHISEEGAADKHKPKYGDKILQVNQVFMRLDYLQGGQHDNQWQQAVDIWTYPRWLHRAHKLDSRMKIQVIKTNNDNQVNCNLLAELAYCCINYITGNLGIQVACISIDLIR